MQCWAINEKSRGIKDYNAIQIALLSYYKDPSVSVDKFEDPILKINEKSKNYSSIIAI